MQDTSALLLVKLTDEKHEQVFTSQDEKGKITKEKHTSHHFAGPSVPGMKVVVIGQHPKNPNEEQLWIVDTTRPVVVALAGETDIKWLHVNEAQEIVTQWGGTMDVSELCIAHVPNIIEPD